MKTRKFLSLALALIMAFAMIPVASLAENVDGLVNEAAAMRKLDNAWAALDAAEADALAQGMSRTEVINAVYTAALSLNTVDKDSFSDFTKDGFYFTVDGMYCAYNYRLRNELGKVTEPANDGIFTIKGSGRNAALKDAESPNVLLLGPYYGYDSNFDDSYKNATQPIADATGGDWELIQGHAATGPAIVEAFPDYGSVFVDSHGAASGSSTYICLTTNECITQEDYNNGWAVRSGSAAWIDGRYIENHTPDTLSNCLVWMAICEGMKRQGQGTTGYALLRAGAGVVYGYSQSVTFIADLTMYLPSFTGGLVGYFSYDYLKYSEPSVRCGEQDEDSFKDVDLMLFDKVIAFDHVRQKIVLIVNMALSDVEVGYNKAKLELAQLVSLLKTGEKKQEAPGRLLGEVTPLFSKEQFCAMVEPAKHHIREGDIFQIVLSNRLSAPFEGSLLDTYRVLRTINPSPYMFYFSGTDVEVAGASPETLVKLKDGVLHTFPLAGTRPRGKTDEEDKALEESLLHDEKELAEHNMLVDLGRNDLGKVSKFGTVQVEKLHSIERYSHVMHIGSTVRGEIRDDRDALDAIEAVLPAGTLSGAPKIRACQLIGELENTKRGIYGGAIGYIDFTGNMDTCIAIRIAYKKNGRVFVRSGAGIVADSVPETEYQECINKAKAVVSALTLAQEEDL